MADRADAELMAGAYGEPPTLRDKVTLMPLSQTHHLRRAGLAIHALTASGAAAGLLALQATIDGHIRAALLWLIVCQVLDGIDGPIARKLAVTDHAPQVDGHILDLVVDYVTCVVVPVAFMVRMDLLPSGWQMAVAALIVFTSALWFARTDLETEDAWFNGFPAAWNVVVPTFLILHIGPMWATIISIALCLLQLTRVKFPHLMRVKAMRKLTIPLMLLYLLALTVLSATFESADLLSGPRWAYWLLTITPLYLLFIVIWRTWFSRRKVLGVSILS